MNHNFTLRLDHFSQSLSINPLFETKPLSNALLQLYREFFNIIKPIFEKRLLCLPSKLLKQLEKGHRRRVKEIIANSSHDIDKGRDQVWICCKTASYLRLV